MKIKFLFVILFTTLFGFAQAPINTFYIDENVSYIVVNSASELNHTVGANQVWNFDQLTDIGVSGYTNPPPTIAESTTYPGTNVVVVGNINNNATQMFTKNEANVVSITGLSAIGLGLNFSTNNAVVGTFPMNYGYTNTDLVAGNYTYTTYSGTFTGNIVTTVDAYGTLTQNQGSIRTSNVTRMKTVITLFLNYGFFTNIGTVTQTTYSYYPDQNLGFNGFLFRSSTTSAVVDLAGIDQTDTVMESFGAILLGTTNNAVRNNQIRIVQNPVKDILQIENPSNEKITFIEIIDMNGRTVLSTNSIENVDVSALQNGVYMANITTDKGKSTQKIIKN